MKQNPKLITREHCLASDLLALTSETEERRELRMAVNLQSVHVSSDRERANLGIMHRAARRATSKGDRVVKKYTGTSS